MTETIDKAELYDIKAEQYILGCLLNNNNYYHSVDTDLKSYYFFDSSHQRIFDKIADLIGNGVVADPITMKNFADNDEGLKEVDGGKYIMKLSSCIAHSLHLKSYIKEVHDYYVKRNVKDRCLEAIEQIDIGGDIDINEELLNLESDLQDIDTSQRTKESLNLHDIIDQVNEDIESGVQEAESSISTGFKNLDNIIGGLARSDLLILGGRPSMGKTAFALNLALNAAEILNDRAEGKKSAVGFFSLEMSAKQLAYRVMSIGTEVSTMNISKGILSQEQKSKLRTCNEIFEDVELLIDDTPMITIDSLRARARKMKTKYNAEVIVVDYLQLMRGNSKASEQNQVMKITEISQGLKRIAKELDIPIIALAQLSRAVESRDDKRPMLSDLRDSGSIEQDADSVMFIYREEYYLSKSEPEEGTNEYCTWQKKMQALEGLTSIIVSKNRHGPTGSCVLKFNGKTQRFVDAGY